MYQVEFVFFMCCVLATAKAGQLKLSTKCNMMDFDCKKDMYQQIFIDAAEGDPDKNIPSVSPMRLSNDVSDLPKNVKLILNNGVVTGIKDCKLVDVHTCMKQPPTTTMALLCNLEIDGRYTVEVPKCVIKELGGEDQGQNIVTGCGKGKVTISNLIMTLSVPFNVKERNDDIYFNVKCLKTTLNEDAKISLKMNNLDVGSTVNNEKITKFLEGNAASINISSITKKLDEFYKAIAYNFITKVPIRTLYSNNNMARYV